ncbi:GAF domain-containing protein [Pontibacter diazotrophicus]|uniref:histidine kinase n=1 Tax=Pontibacter diazotrophicus TaxID=1400979 RepID=A0A3D8L9B6_9BACT|nr:ATP-binding protein [Pontibacter diazotrophicus]RDV13995.1 GAF domain-containing protein [Pontibacter diazotrophicus]
MQNYNNLNVDLSNCDTEPIHIIGRIQPHGFLFILDQATLQIEQVSQNVEQYLQIKAEKLLGKHITAICREEEQAKLVEQLNQTHKGSPQLLQLQGQQFFGFLHLEGQKLMLEFEPMPQTTAQGRLENSLAFCHFQYELNEHHVLESQANLLLEFVQQTLGYDRVMLYVFDEDWHGEVIAEKIKPGIRSYLHHHFPSTDIPGPARALLMKKHVRQIPDVHATAVDIMPYMNPTTGKPSNIIRSELRNPSEIHLEYLRNMEVSATLSFSILVRNKLWGLITCHHTTPLFIDYWKRMACNLAAMAFSNAIIASSEKRDVHKFNKQKQLEEALLAQVNLAGDLFKGLFEQQHTLLHLTSCQGAAVYFNSTLRAAGKTPSDDQIRGIIDWLSEKKEERIFSTRELSKHLPAAVHYADTASGLLAVEISRYNKEYILYFKPEIQEKRIWAGDPEKPTASADLRVHPRKSFSRWEEIIKGKSLPWSLNDLEIAQILQKDITAILLRNQANKLKDLNQEMEASAEELRQKNNRLEDFAHIISHNLRSPMSNMQGLYALYKEDPTQETVVEVMKRMNQMIHNMSDTVQDLNLILDVALDQQLQQTKVQVADVIEKQLQNMQAAILKSNALIETDLQVQEIPTSKVYFESILHNLLSNALKYSADGRRPIIKIKTWQEDKQICLAVSDNGMGMDLEKMGHKVFGLYNTFHKGKDSKGIGLYLTKMQVKSLGGDIAVESAPDQGATFEVRFITAQH